MLRPIPKDDFVRRFRLKASLRALERVRKTIGERAYQRLRDLVVFRLEGREFEIDKVGEKIVVAYSGGSDSTATLKILRWAGFEVIPVMARLPQLREPVVLKATMEGAILVDVPGYMEEMKRLIEKRAPICGRCHSMVMKAVESYALDNGIKIVASGDLLSFGSASIYEKGSIIVLNLPAFLTLTKAEAIKILGRKYALGFGCPLWRSATKRAPILKRFGIQRILRELRAGALTEDMAKVLIMDVLRA
ncbi:ATPase [Pyrococcus yayanosii]|nr:ATPase [Pyrococcus yayanosii]